MLLTTNYGLRKPEGTDPVDVQDFNDNADIIDSELKKRPTSTGNASSMTNEFTPTDSLVNLVSGEEQKTLFGKISKAIASLISHLSNKSNPHGVTKAQVGLGSVDNTADANKPVSTAQANAIADAKKAGTDAQGNLTEHTGNKSNPHVVTKSQVGLGNVPNVSTNDQTPTYTDATSVAKLKSGEKLSVAFGKIAKAVSTLISHISTSASTSTAGHVKFGTASGTACQGNDSRLSDSRPPLSHASPGTSYGAGSTSYYGHVKLTDSTAVTDSTGLALPATEKNASIEGTLANQISSLKATVDRALGTVRTAVIDIASYNTVSNMYTFPHDGYVVASSETATSGLIRVAICDCDGYPVSFIYHTITDIYQIYSVYVKKGMKAYASIVASGAIVQFYGL